MAVAKEKSGYYGQRRKFWSWGYEGEANSKDEIRTMRDRVEQRLGIKDIEILSDPTLDEIELYASRIKIPRTLEDFCTSEKWDRIVPVSYTHLRAHETPEHLVCRLLLEKKKKTHTMYQSQHSTCTPKSCDAQ